MKQFARWCLLHGPELVGRDGLPDPAKMRIGCLIDGVLEGEARMHALFLASATIGKDGRPLPVSTVQAVCSAIRYMYMKNRVLVADETKVEMSRVLKGHRRVWKTSR